MTREEIESEITCLRMVRDAYGETPLAVDRAIGRLRADLAKLDGPAPGFARVRIEVYRNHRGLLHADIIREGHVPDDSSLAIVVADVPIPCVIEIEGKVEK